MKILGNDTDVSSLITGIEKNRLLDPISRT